MYNEIDSVFSMMKWILHTTSYDIVTLFSVMMNANYFFVKYKYMYTTLLQHKFQLRPTWQV